MWLMCKVILKNRDIEKERENDNNDLLVAMDNEKVATFERRRVSASGSDVESLVGAAAAAAAAAVKRDAGVRRLNNPIKVSGAGCK